MGQLLSYNTNEEINQFYKDFDILKRIYKIEKLIKDHDKDFKFSNISNILLSTTSLSECREYEEKLNMFENEYYYALITIETHGYDSFLALQLYENLKFMTSNNITIRLNKIKEFFKTIQSKQLMDIYKEFDYLSDNLNKFNSDLKRKIFLKKIELIESMMH